MSFQTTLTADAAITVVAGAEPKTFVEDGVVIPNGKHFAVTQDGADSRTTMTVKVKQPSLDASTGTFSKGKRSIVIAKPSQQNGKVYFATVRIEVEYHPSADFAETEKLMNLSAQLLTGPDFSNYWIMGSLS